VAVDSPVSYTYAQLDHEANKIAHWGIANGLVLGDVVNTFDFFFNFWLLIDCWIEINK